MGTGILIRRLCGGIRYDEIPTDGSYIQAYDELGTCFTPQNTITRSWRDCNGNLRIDDIPADYLLTTDGCYRRGPLWRRCGDSYEGQASFIDGEPPPEFGLAYDNFGQCYDQVWTYCGNRTFNNRGRPPINYLFSPEGNCWREPVEVQTTPVTCEQTFPYPDPSATRCCPDGQNICADLLNEDCTLTENIIYQSCAGLGCTNGVCNDPTPPTCEPLRDTFVGCFGNGIGIFNTGEAIRSQTGEIVCVTALRDHAPCLNQTPPPPAVCDCHQFNSLQDSLTGIYYPSKVTYVPCGETNTISRTFTGDSSACAKPGTLSVIHDDPTVNPSAREIFQSTEGTRRYTINTYLNISSGACRNDGECVPLIRPTPTPTLPTPTPTPTPIAQIATPTLTPSLTVQTPTPTPTPQTPTPTPTPTWRSCVDGALNTGVAPSDYKATVYSGAGGGVCWEPRYTIGFEPSLQTALSFFYRRGTSQYPSPVTVKVTNPSYASSYRVTFNTNPDIIITPKAFTLTPRSTESVIINVTPTLYDKLGDGVSNIGLDIDISEI